MSIEFIHTKTHSNAYKKHHHPMLAISTIKKGKIYIVYDDKEALLLPNTLAIFNPYENHKTTDIDENSSDYYTLYCDLPWCENIQKELYESEDFLELKPLIIEDKLLYETFLSLYDSLDEKEVSLFMRELFKRYCSVQSAKEVKDKKSKALKKIKLFLEDADYKTVTVDLLSQSANVNPNYLIKLFKKEYGLSPHAYIINQKIYKSKKLLEQNIPIAEVAIELGFFDQSHFHKAFKSVYAITPKEFQKG
jgi:AraC-like DNA-binding protein